MRSAMCLYQILWLMIHPHPGYEVGYYQYEYESEPFWTTEDSAYDGIIQYLQGEADFSQPPYKNDPRVEEEGPYVDNVLGGDVTVNAFEDNYFYKIFGADRSFVFDRGALINNHKTTTVVAQILHRNVCTLVRAKRFGVHDQHI